MAATRRAPFGTLLQTWRKARSLSQLALAHDARVSPRHVSFLETGRSTPSREMVLRLAAAMSIPLREQNSLLLAAGFAPHYGESTLEDPMLRIVRQAVDAILQQHEPFPAVVMDSQWNILLANRGATQLFRFLLRDRPLEGADNVLRVILHPDGVRPYIANWDEVAISLIRRVSREGLRSGNDDMLDRLLHDVVGNVAMLDSAFDAEPLLPVVPVRFRRDGRSYDFFSAITTLGTPLDVTAEELRIESMFPANLETAQAVDRDFAMSGSANGST